MREILFRGKRIDNGHWIHGYLIDNIYGAKYPVILKNPDYDDANRICFDWEFVDPETVGQYTGLTDKNGKKIFEGDVVIDKFDNEKYGFVGVVTYIPERTQFEVVSKKHPNYIVNLGARASGANSIIIIGNIHDNPELLKKEIEK